jgi:GntR family transcriptional regulator
MKKTDADRLSTFPVDRIPQLAEPSRRDVQLYVQIYDVLYELIRSGEAAPGSLIPGENLLATHFGVSRGTIRQALRYLEEDGLVMKRQGRGSEIADSAGHQLGGLQEYSDVCRSFCTVPITRVSVRWKYTGVGRWLSEQLALAKGALILSADVLYYSGSDAIALSQRLIPSPLLETYSVDPNSEEEMRGFILDTIPQAIAHTRSEIMIQTEAISDQLDSNGIPFFSISEITYDAQDHPVSHMKNYLRSDSYRIYVNRRQRSR